MIFQIMAGEAIAGNLRYVKEDKSVDFTPEDRNFSPSVLQNTAALVVGGTLQIEFQISDGRLLYVWGYSPEESFRSEEEDLNLPDFKDGEIRVEQFSAENGMGYDTALVNKPVLRYKNGFLLIGEKQASSFVRIADGLILGIDDGSLKSVIIGPLSV